MTIFNFLELIGGLALFLYGMHVLGEGLTTISGGKMEQILEKLSSTKFRALLLGAGVTAVIQSSSATTVMVVALVNAGVMRLRQAVPIIMGANIGTTATGWILSLSGISGDSLFVQFLKPSSFTPIVALLGILFIFIGKNPGKKATGNALLGFSILMFGMGTMSGSVAPLQSDPNFQEAFQIFTNPFLGVLVGAILTAIIQSSSAMTGILQALSTTGAITFSSAIPLIMGQNIGTCITAILATIGANKNAKRAAFVHLNFNVIGTLIFMLLFYSIQNIVGFAFYNDQVNEVGIALIHTIFNVLTVMVLFPFSDYLVKLSQKVIPSSKEGHEEDSFEIAVRNLDDRFLERPGFAVEQAFTVFNKMMSTATECVDHALDLIHDYQKDKHEALRELEKQVNKYEQALLDYTVKITGSQLNKADNDKLGIILHTLADVERIGDYAFSIANQAKIKASSPMCFSQEAKEELKLYTELIDEIMEKTKFALLNLDMESAMEVHILEETTNIVDKALEAKHVLRLQTGSCNIKNGLSIMSVYDALERIADHCDNVGDHVYEFSEQYNKHPDVDSRMDESNPLYRGMIESNRNRFLNSYVLTFEGQ